MKVTVHLTPLEREWLARLDAQRTAAAAAMLQAQRDFDIAATTAAAARGLVPAAIGGLELAGLLVELPVDVADA